MESALTKHWVYAAAALALVLSGAGLMVFLEDSAEDRGPQIVDLSIPPRSDTDDGMRRIPLDPGLTQAQASPATTTAGWVWPTRGDVVVTYAAEDPTRHNIEIAGDFGQPVRAVHDGQMVYSGAGLVIIKHSPDLLTVYGHTRVRLVKKGDKVKSGQKIAEMGMNDANRVLLHFAVRMNGKPADLLSLLPARTPAQLVTP